MKISFLIVMLEKSSLQEMFELVVFAQSAL